MSIAVDEGETDTVHYVVFPELLDSVADILVEMTIWMFGGSRISGAFQCQINNRID